MKRYDIAICDCPVGPHLETHEHEGGDHCDADEALAEIASRDAEIHALREENALLEGALRALVEEMSLPLRGEPTYRDWTCTVERETYERVKALLDGEPPASCLVRQRERW